MKQNIRLLIEYDGTEYVGWQRQTNLRSVQGEIEAALGRITQQAPETLGLTCAGRTDAGVHALGQVANFYTHKTLEPKRFATALNFWLPESIRIHRADGVAEDFDARRSAVSKRYRYRVYVGPHPLALDGRRAWHIHRLPMLDAMREAAQHLVGEHDFESFRSSHCDALHARRHMYEIDITTSQRPPLGQFVDITLHADAFCRHMCRILAGSLVQVGRGRKSVGWIRETLDKKLRSEAGVTAPPWGLTMLEVLYPDASDR